MPQAATPEAGMDQSLWLFVFAMLVVVTIAAARFIKLLLFPDHTRHDLTVCKDRLREMDYRIGDVLKELKAIRELLEARRDPVPEQRITTDEDKGIRRGDD
jgi:hypothetical protein